VSAQSRSGQGKLGRNVAQLTTLIVSLKMSICTVRTGNRGSRQEGWESYARIAQLYFEVNEGSTMERSDR
jgi:hypothetical protein